MVVVVETATYQPCEATCEQRAFLLPLLFIRVTVTARDRRSAFSAGGKTRLVPRLRPVFRDGTSKPIPKRLELARNPPRRVRFGYRTSTDVAAGGRRARPALWRSCSRARSVRSAPPPSSRRRAAAATAADTAADARRAPLSRSPALPARWTTPTLGWSSCTTPSRTTISSTS